MNHLFWNCRGLGQASSVQELAQLVLKERPKVLFLSETKKRSKDMIGIQRKLGFDNLLTVDCQGKSGGLALLWNETDVKVVLLSYSQHHIDVELDSKWRCTGLYGYAETGNKHKTWELLRNIKAHSLLPWIVGGDFNEILRNSEKLGGAVRSHLMLQDFKDALDFCELIEIKTVGPAYTWCNKNFTGSLIYERLDRCVVSESWLQLFPRAVVRNGIAVSSDHLPIILETEAVLLRQGVRRSFKYENFWGAYEKSKDIVVANWLSSSSWGENIQRTSSALQQWSLSEFGNLRRSIIKCELNLKKLMAAPSGNKDKIQQVEVQMRKLLDSEAVYWKQRSKKLWSTDGDRNTKFFHQCVNRRRRRNLITGIQDEHGDWVTDQVLVADIISGHFKENFQESKCDLSKVTEVTNLIQAKITSDIADNLFAPFRSEEVVAALQTMHPIKAPGPDGLGVGFFTTFWDQVGMQVTSLVLDILNGGQIPSMLNHTHIVLIPKCKNPLKPVDFRPISLCNVVMKLVTKVLVLRLKPWMKSIVSENQSGFISGRSLIDNAAIAFELIHTLLHKNGKKGFLALKLDITKAYDRLEWQFIEKCLIRLGFSAAWVSLIMKCVTSVSYSILINGQPAEPFVPSRGLRQGDPLSPLIYVLCSEAFSALLDSKITAGKLQGLAVSPSGTKISSLLFADDSLIFSRAREGDCLSILEVLQDYRMAAGQAINFSKSSIIFSPNLSGDRILFLKSLLNVQLEMSSNRYLGLPLILGKKKAESFNHIKDKIRNKLSVWKGKWLSKAGKEVLIKAVIQALPSYSMSLFQLSSGFLKDLAIFCKNFFWGSDQGSKKIHWVKWEDLCVKKEEGGLGFKDLETQNSALLAKIGWKMVTEPNNLMCRIFKEKYFKNGHFMHASLGHSPSVVWKSILVGRKVLLEGGKWRIGDGHTVKVFQDNWVPNQSSLLHLSNISQKVYEFLEYPHSRWDTLKIHNTFPSDTAANILSIPLSRFRVQDQFIWTANSNGIYSVKSGYHVLKNLSGQIRNAGTTFNWNSIWKLQVPPKIRHFLWKLAKNVLPTKLNLNKRGGQFNSVCDTCGLFDDTIEHLFHDCSWAKTVWHLLHLDEFVVASVSNFSNWLLDIITHTNSDIAITGALTLWSIWLNRNKSTFDLACDLPKYAVLGILKWKQSLQLNVSVGNSVNTIQPLSNVKWIAPAVNFMKINFDARFLVAKGQNRYGIVIRNCLGDVLLAKMGKLQDLESATQAEALAALQAVELAKELGLENVILEGDCQLLIKALESADSSFTIWGHIVADIKTLVRIYFQKCVFSFVRRDGNKVAHSLASCIGLEATLEYDALPLGVKVLVHKDIFH